MTPKRMLPVVFLVAALVVPAGRAAAQGAAKAQTGTQFYTAYLAAFEKAKTIDELLPWLAKAQRDQIEKTPKAERAQMFGMIKEMSADNTGIKVLKETPSAAGADLDVQATSRADQKPVKGKVTLVKENGEWKLGKESWSSGS